jgi:Ser/Thr protein kinase RdoA (MazF antagonist)
MNGVVKPAHSSPDLAAIVKAALAKWDLMGADYHLVAERENRVFQVRLKGGTFALRLHRPGYRNDAELRSELSWMRMLSDEGLLVPTPQATKDGQLLCTIDGFQIDCLNWLNGTPLGKTGHPITLENLPKRMVSIGRDIARLHHYSDTWTPDADFTRWHWDQEGLIGEQPVWGAFWENPDISEAQRDLFLEAKAFANQQLNKHHTSLDYGLIHADLVRENILLGEQGTQFIDFDDGGYGYRLFELATLLSKLTDRDDFEQLKAALLDGYRQVRAIDTALLDLFMMIRALTYLGWIIPRLSEPGGTARNARFIATAEHWAGKLLQERF